jgi:hypothetical protein
MDTETTKQDFVFFKRFKKNSSRLADVDIENPLGGGTSLIPILLVRELLTRGR